jgi:hypothetical protein
MPARSDGPAAADVLLDVAGFVGGIVLAYSFGWRTGDLVWGLWLSSLVIGYATLVFGIVGARTGKVPTVFAFGGKLFLIGFFTVHFGMFHLGHSVFLNLFFPVLEGDPGFSPGLCGYGEVFRRYWPWLAVAAIAERRTLLPGAPALEATPPASCDAAGSEQVRQLGFNPMGPYKNVVRMHLLIFFFFAMFLVGIDNFAVYVVVYAVYFWPWRMFGWVPRRMGAS